MINEGEVFYLLNIRSFIKSQFFFKKSGLPSFIRYSFFTMPYFPQLPALQLRVRH